MSLTRRLDGLETRFLIQWTTAWIAMLVLGCAALELFAAVRRSIDPDVTTAIIVEWLDFYLLETLTLTLLFVASPILVWMALAGIYPRPSLAAWIGWSVIGLLAMILAAAISLAIMISFDDTEVQDVPTIVVGPGAYFLGYLTDLASKLGFILAFLVISWRTGWSLTVAFAVLTLILSLSGFSTVVNDFIESLEGEDDFEIWGQGVAWAELPIWMVEMVVLGLGSGLAVIYGNRWQVRDVDDKVFD